MSCEECKEFLGRKKEICEGTADLPIYKINQYRQQWGLGPLPKAVISSVVPTKNIKINKNKNKKQKFELVGKALEKRINGLIKIKTGKSCNCKNLAADMNLWGVDGCEERRELIVNHLLNNKDMLADAISSIGTIHSVIGWAVNNKFFEPALKAGANWLLSEAINDVKKEIESKKLKTANNINTIRKGKSPFAMGKDDIRFISSQQLQIDIKTFIGKIPHDVTAIAGVARSGLSVATMLSMYLHLPLIIVRQTAGDVIDGGNGWRLGGSKHINPNKDKVLVVDDTVMTGNSFKVIKPLVAKHFKNVVFGAIYVNPAAYTKPDIWAVDLPWPHILEWNVFNSILTPSCGTDFDGVLCLDCPSGSDDDGPKYLEFINSAKPLYITRRSPIPLIVTARIEKYREPTENWLKKHGIEWEKLVMHPAKTLRERERDNIPLFKYNNFKQWADKHNSRMRPLIYFESEDWQAREIGKLNKDSKRVIVCPSSGKVY